MKRCTLCNKPNPDNAKKCFHCKTDILNVPIEPMQEIISPSTEIPDFKGTSKEFTKDMTSKIKDFLKNTSLVSIIISVLIGILLSVDLFIKKSFLLSIVCFLSGILLGFFIHTLNKIFSLIEKILNKN